MLHVIPRVSEPYGSALSVPAQWTRSLPSYGRAAG